MRFWLRAHLTYANVVSSVCLFLVVGGGAVAWAAFAPPDSIDHQALRPDSVRRSEIKHDAVGRTEVRDDSLTGRHIVESQLLRVRRARNANLLGGVPLRGIAVGRVNHESCDPNVNDAGGGDSTCGEVAGPIPREGRVLVMATLQWHTSGDQAPTQAVCELQMDNLRIGEPAFIGELGTEEQTDSTHPRNATLMTITEPVAPGDHSFELICSEGDFGLDINRTSLVTVLLGAG